MKTVTRLYILLITLSLSFMLSASALADGPRCASLFTEKISTEQINQAITELAALRLDIDQTQVNGTGSVARTLLKQKFEKRQAQIVNYLELSGIMSRAQYFERIKNEIAKLQGRKENQEVESKEERDRAAQGLRAQIAQNITQTRAHRIEPGSFRFWNGPKTGDIITLTRPYDMMETLTTQYLWRQVIWLAQRRFPNQHSIYSEPSHFKGDDLPVESVDMETVVDWLDALNHLSADGEPKLADLIIGHKNGDTYRLPTEAEWAFVFQGRGKIDPALIDGKKHGWFAENADNKTHPVRQKEPLIVDGHKFYDMLGNVWELTSDFARRRNLNENFEPIIRGGGHDSPVIVDQFLKTRAAFNAEQPDKAVGFRLVRDVRVVKQATPAPTPTPKKSLWQKLSEKLKR